MLMAKRIPPEPRVNANASSHISLTLGLDPYTVTEYGGYVRVKSAPSLHRLRDGHNLHRLRDRICVLAAVPLIMTASPFDSMPAAPAISTRTGLRIARGIHDFQENRSLRAARRVKKDSGHLLDGGGAFVTLRAPCRGCHSRVGRFSASAPTPRRHDLRLNIF